MKKKEIRKEWEDEECEISIVKEAGKIGSIQKYIGNPESIMTLIASMIETLISNKILTTKELEIAIESALEVVKKEEKE